MTPRLLPFDTMLFRHAGERRRLWNQAVSVLAEGARRVGSMVVQHQLDIAAHALAQLGLELHISAEAREKREREVRERAWMSEQLILLGEKEEALKLAVADAAKLERHLKELDELLAGVGQSERSQACRRVVDVALGRAVEPAA